MLLSNVGVLGIQIRAIFYLFTYFLGVTTLQGAVLGAGLVVFYSSFGGIRAVTATDIYKDWSNMLSMYVRAHEIHQWSIMRCAPELIAQSNLKLRQVTNSKPQERQANCQR